LRSAPPQARSPGAKSITRHKRLEQAIAADGRGVSGAHEGAYLSGSIVKRRVRAGRAKRSMADASAGRFQSGGIRFFDTMKIPIVAGRGFGAQDTESSPKVAVIQPGWHTSVEMNPIGKRFRKSTDGRGIGPQIVVVATRQTVDGEHGAGPEAQFYALWQMQDDLT